ncbi:discoidin domain-containing protein [bacterium]|nr:discoidin domain-containing protein [bacterium]
MKYKTNIFLGLFLLCFFITQTAAQTDLTTGKNCYASGTYGTYYPWHIRNDAIGGEANGWMTPSQSPSQWVYVDLGSNNLIDRVNVYTRHCNNTSLYLTSWTIQTSTDASTWYNRYAITGNGTNGWRLCSFTAVTARYVRLTNFNFNTSNETLYRTLDEIQVFAVADCPGCPPSTYYGTYSPGSSWSTHSYSVVTNGCIWYRFSLNTSYEYTFTFCDGGGSYTGDPYLELYNSSCGVVASNNNYCSYGSQITYCPTASGTYYLRVRGNGYTAISSYTLAWRGLDDIAGPTAASGSPTSICVGGTITLTASGGYGGDYWWTWGNRGICGSFIGTGSPVVWEPDAPGNYHVYVERRGTYCGYNRGSNAFREFWVYVYEDPEITIYSDTTIHLGDNVTLTSTTTGGTGGCNYQWEYSTDGGTTWYSLPGGYSSSLTTAPTVTTQYRCLRTCNGPGCNSKYSNIVTVTLQYYLTVTSPYGTPRGSGWYNSGTSATAWIAEGCPISGGTGTRYNFDSWTIDASGTNCLASNPIIMDGNKTATATWHVEYLLTVNTAHGTQTGQGWYSAGATPSAGILEGCPIYEGGTRYIFEGWTDDASGTNCIASNPITMDGPKTATATWHTEYYLTVTTAHGTGGGEGWYIAGANANATIPEGCPIVIGGTRYVFESWSGDASGFNCNLSSNIIMDRPKEAIANWHTEYYLTVISTYGTTTGENWYIAGSNAMAGIIGGCPIMVGDSMRYFFDGWSGDASGLNCLASDNILMDGPKTATANWHIEYYLTVDNGGRGTATGDNWYAAGTVANAGIAEGCPIPGGTGIQYAFDGWTDDATGSNCSSSDDIVMNGPRTATATWHTEYLLTVNSPYGTPTGGGWYAAGATAYAGIAEGCPIFTEGARYYFQHWTGNASGTDCDSSDAITMDSPKTANAIWYTEYYLTVNTPFGTATGAGWYAAGSVANAGIAEGCTIYTAPGVRRIFDSWTGNASGNDCHSSSDIIMDDAKTATAIWNTEYYLTVDYTGTGVYVPTQTGEGWYAAGTNAPITSQDTVFAGDTLYVFSSWVSTPAGAAIANPFNNVTTILMNNAYTATANYSTEIKLLIVGAPAEHDTPTPGYGIHWYTPGTNIAAFVDSITEVVVGVDRYRCNGYTASGSGLPPAGASDSVNFNITSPTVITWHWVHQYYLTMGTNFGTVTPGSGWYDEGTVLNIQAYHPAVVDGERYIWNEWTGTGTGSYAGSDNPATITMLDNIRETASWTHQFRLTVSSAHDAPIPSVGPHWYNVGAYVDASVTSPADEAGGVRYRCTGWTATGSPPPAGDSTHFGFDIDTVSTITWNWMTQYHLTMLTNFGTVTPGDGWYDEGTVVNIDAAAPATIDGERYVWLGWTGVGTISYTGMVSPVDITMNSPITQTARWRHEYRLWVYSDHDAPVPAVGEHWIEAGTSVSAWVTTPADEADSIRWRCTGWVGTGSAPAAGPGASFTFVINDTTSITWLWLRQFYLTMFTNFGTVTPGSGWFDEGTVVNIDANSPSTIPEERYVWNGWTGTGTGSYTGIVKDTLITMDTVITQTADWIHQYYLTMVTNFGTFTPPSGWYDAGSFIEIEATSPPPDFDGERYFWLGWTGVGDTSYTGMDNPANITLMSPIRETAEWRHEYRLMVNSDYGSADPPIGENWLEAGSVVYASADSTFGFTDSTRLRCQGFFGDGSTPPFGVTNWTIFVIDTASEITWVWVSQYRLIIVSEFGYIIPGDTTWHDEGTHVLFMAAMTPVTDEGERYIWLGWTGSGDSSYTGLNNPAHLIMNSPIWEVASWSHQYRLTMYTNHGTVSPGSGWFEAGSDVLIDASPPDTIPGERYIWLGWTGFGTVSYTGMDTSHIITMNSAIAETAAWSYDVRFTVISPYGTPDPPVGHHYYPVGTVVHASVDSFILLGTGDTRRLCLGWAGTGSVPPVGYLNEVTLTIYGPSSIEWLWKTQYLLTMTTDCGFLVPGTSWQDSSLMLAINSIPPIAVDGERFTWEGWVGTGDGSYTGVSNPAVVFMNAPLQQHASWRHEFRLTVISDHDSPDPAVGDHWFEAGTEITAHVTSPADEDSGARYICTGWTGSGSVPPAGSDTTITFNLDTVTVITWNWGTQYYLLMTTDFGTLTPGDGWYDAGAVVPIRAFPPGVGAGERFIWEGWTGTGTVSYTGLNNPDSVIMNSTIHQHASWRHEFMLFVTSTHDAPDPTNGLHWYEEGTEITATVDSITDVFGERRSRCTGWEGTGSVPATGTNATVTFTITEASDLNWTWMTQFYFEILTAHSAPCPGYVAWYDSGAVVNGCVEESTETYGDTMRYLFTNWSDDATGDIYDASDDITLDEPKDAQANWVKQYYIELDYAGCGGAVPVQTGEGFYDEGTWAAITTEDTVYEGLTPYNFTQWVSDGDLADTFSSSTTILVDGPHTATAAYEIGVAYVIIQTDFDEGTIIADGVTYDSPCSLVWLAASEHSISTDSIQVIEPGVRYAFDSWSDRGARTHNVITDNDTTFTAFFTLQYQFTVISDYGAPDPAVGSYWFEVGTTISGYVNSIDFISHQFCTSYTATGDLAPGAADTAFSFVISTPTSITWDWHTMFSLTQTSTPPGVIPGGISWHLPGEDIDASVPDTIYVAPAIRYVCEGWTATGSPPLNGDTSYVNFIIHENSTINWLWRKEYAFIVYNPDGFGTPVPATGRHWYTEYDTIHGWVTSPVEDTIYCIGYNGTGSLVSSSSDSFWFVITTPSTVTWLWDIVPVGSELETLIVYSEYGHPLPTGISIYPRGTAITAYVEDSVFEGGAWHYCTGWIASGSPPTVGDSNLIVFTINEFSIITWQWDGATRYPFTVYNPGSHDTPVPPVGIHWFDVGAIVNGWVDLMSVEGTDTFFCSGYYGSGSLTDDFDTTFSFIIMTPSAVTWRWVGREGAVNLHVFTAHGDPIPSVGGHYYIPGTGIRASVDYIVNEGLGERYISTGWNGTGSVPTTGDTNFVSFIINENSTLTWLWQAQFRFVVVSDHGVPVPAVGEYWYDDGTEISGWVNRFDGEWVCIGYDGTGSLESDIETTFTFIIDAPSSVTWLWHERTDIEVLRVISEYGSPEPPVGIHYYVEGTNIVAFMPETLVVMGGTRGICRGWSGMGSAPPGGTYFDFTFAITESTTIIWNWETQYYIDLEYAGAGGYVPIQDGEGWYAAASNVPIYSEYLVGVDDDRYVFSHWTTTPGGAFILDDFAFATTIFADEAYIVTANYVTGVKCIIRKFPLHSVGNIFYDTDSVFTDVPSVTVWWLPGTFHEIGVTAVDSTDSIIYYFTNWEDASTESLRAVGPVNNDTLFTAYYDREYYCTVSKDPLEPYGSLVVDRDSWTGVGSTIQDFWWPEGTVHFMRVSDTDYYGDTIRYVFSHWSDGGEISHTSSEIDAPTDFIAYYTKQLECHIVKEPFEAYGSIILDADSFFSAGELYFWANEGDSYEIGVSEIDVSDDTIFFFDHWSDGGGIVHNTIEITVPSEFIAYYTTSALNLSICLDRNVWDLDTMAVGELATMDISEMISITNCGNIEYDLALSIRSSGAFWAPAYSPGEDQYVLRAEFTDVILVPTEFHPSLDQVKTFVTWSSDLIFGPAGYDVEVGEEQYLWMQFLTPILSSIYNEEQTIVVLLRARVALP